MTGKMLTPEQVAERLAVTPNTVRGWLRNGMLKGVKLGNKVWRVREEALEAYICHEQSVEYGINGLEKGLGEDDLKAIRRGLEDIKAGRFVTLEDYQVHKDDPAFAEEILTDLVKQGYSGEKLLTEFKKINRKIRPAVEKLIEEADEIAKASSANYIDKTDEIFGDDEETEV